MSLFSALPPAVKITTPAEAEALIEHLSENMLIAFDTETTGLVRHKDYALILSLSDGIGRWAIWPGALPYFQDFLEDPRRRLIGHNVNFDQWMLLNVGIDLSRRCPRAHARVIDTMVMHALYDDGAAHDLKYLARQYLGIEMIPFKQLYGAQMRKRSLDAILLDPANEAMTVNYAALDAYATYKLFLRLQNQLQKSTIEPGPDGTPYANLWDYYIQTELLYTKVLWSLEREGILLSQDDLLRRAPKLELEALQVMGWFAKKMRRFDVNLNSIPQMQLLFFRDLNYTPLGYTDDGAPQVSKVALKAWAKKGCEYSNNLLRYRDITKNLNTYVLGLLDKVANDGKIHCTFVQTGARTGRLAARDPNLQNQPGSIRDAYLADEGHVLYARDFAQLEMRLLAHMSGDPTLVDAIRTGKDVHSATAASMYGISYDALVAAKDKHDANGVAKLKGIPYEEMTPAELALLKLRAGAKTINFGIMYGMGPAKLGRELGLSTAEAKVIIRKYFDAMPLIEVYFRKAIAFARKHGFCQTLLGRRRQVRQIWSPLSGEVARAERQVKNAPIQGFASEIVKLAMLDIFCDDYISASGTKMLIQVHDEIVFSMPRACVDDQELIGRIASHMSNAVCKVLGKSLLVNLDTTGASGATWADCK